MIIIQIDIMCMIIYWIIKKDSNPILFLILVLIELEGLAKGGWVRDTVCDAAKQALKILKNIDSAAVKFVTTKGSSFKSTTCFEEESNFVWFVGLAIKMSKFSF